MAEEAKQPSPENKEEPKEEQKGDKKKPVIPQSQAYSLANFRVLIVDDYPFMTELMTSMLREFGVGHLMQSEGGQDAKEILTICNADPASRNPVDLVILDWLMPEFDGVDLLEWIRNHKKDSVKFVPVILCSAYTSETVVIKGRDFGANEVLVKPVSAEKFSKRILHVIDNPRPFIKAPDFFGPDRRRRDETFSGEDKRKTTEDDVKVFHERE